MRTPQGYRSLNLAIVLIKIISGIRYLPSADNW